MVYPRTSSGMATKVQQPREQGGGESDLENSCLAFKKTWLRLFSFNRAELCDPACLAQQLTYGTWEMLAHLSIDYFRHLIISGMTFSLKF